MLENSLAAHFMDLEFTTLQTGTVMKDHGMKGGFKAWDCSPSKMEK